MVDLAFKAFMTQNFNLAADIYEKNIKENGPKKELYLGLADSLSKSGQLRKAFKYYTNAFRLGKVKHEELGHLVSALIDLLREKKNVESKAQAKKVIDIFACFLCKSKWADPVTLGCGHTFCRKCLDKTETKTEVCKECGMATFTKVSSLKSNVLLSSTLENWFPDLVQAAKLKSEGNKYFEKRQFKEAIKAYSEAYKYAPNCHLLLSNRSYAYASLEQYKEALDDADLVIKLCPDWPKGHFRRGAALIGLERHEEAALAYLRCLTLDPKILTARTALEKCIHKLMTLASLEEIDLKETEKPGIVSPLSQPCDGASDPSSHSTSSDESFRDLLCQIEDFHKPEATSTVPNENSSGASASTSEDVSSSASSANLENGTLEPNMESCQKDGANSSSSTSPDMNSLSSRKRSCSDVISEPSSPSKETPAKFPRPNTKNTASQQVAKELVNKDDFDCSLCYRLLFKPVTTPCGHSFCRQCLDRCMDHNCHCPLCKSSLMQYLAERRQATTEAIEDIIQQFFPDEYMERKKQFDQEMAHLAKMGTDSQYEIPIFVCTMAYPTISCPLHIFEPRYRLMVRRCIESGSRQFGMCFCLEENEKNFAEYGCMLEIRDIKFFPDGRSVLDTVGGRRFKVISRGHCDGYLTAKVEFLEEIQPPTEEERKELQILHAEVHKESSDWFSSCTPLIASRIRQRFGSFPALDSNLAELPQGPGWLWWMIAALPLDPRAQISLLAMRSLKERLLAVRRVLNHVKRNRSQ